jgi:hypothetical protein
MQRFASPLGGDFAGALALFQRSLAAQNPGNPAFLFDLSRALGAVSNAHKAQAHFAGASAAYREAREIARELRTDTRSRDFRGEGRRLGSEVFADVTATTATKLQGRAPFPRARSRQRPPAAAPPTRSGAQSQRPPSQNRREHEPSLSTLDYKGLHQAGRRRQR